MRLITCTPIIVCCIFTLVACGGGSGGGSGGGGASNSGGGGGNNTPQNSPLDPLSEVPTRDASLSYNDVSVHDPSIVQSDSGSFYVVGSHLATAKTDDFVSWEAISDGVNDANPLFDTYATEISEGIDYVGGEVGSWASHIIRSPDDRWYLYYNHCATPPAGICNYPRSYLGVAVGDDIEGPYSDLGIFIWSGQSQEELDNDEFVVGDVSTYDPTIHPNAIDPHTFYDQDQQLWMVYGSYSGGLFVLRMDDTTGKPVPGQGYGTHIAGGNHSAIEGPFILYSPETEYYYLFMSFGGFGADDGYNMRIARSRNPDGPYLDAEFNDMVLASGNWASIAPYGVKLMGGFSFEFNNGAQTWGYKAPGHNSAYYDETTGRHLLIFHTRFPNRGEFHAIRTHELFVTEDDWLTVSPQRYAPLEGNNVVGETDAEGDYQLILHGKDINRTPRPSVNVSFESDGSISGDVTGSYDLDGVEDDDIILTVDGRQYTGVILWQWNITAQKMVPVVSALSDDGQTLWATKDL